MTANNLHGPRHAFVSPTLISKTKSNPSTLAYYSARPRRDSGPTSSQVQGPLENHPEPPNGP